MLRIGLTGGIGSGKSMVAKIFESLRIPVYYADDRTKHLMNSDPQLIADLKKHFGSKTYSAGTLDRQYLAGIVFNNQEKLTLLNSLTHPATINDANQWMKEQTSRYIIKEAALLFESGAGEHLDNIIGVHAPAALRMQRVMMRDHLCADDVQKIMDRQMDEETKMKLCDYIITNDETQLVIPQVLLLHEKFNRPPGK